MNATTSLQPHSPTPARAPARLRVIETSRVHVQGVQRDCARRRWHKRMGIHRAVAHGEEVLLELHDVGAG
jgi:hypothetical protein